MQIAGRQATCGRPTARRPAPGSLAPGRPAPGPGYLAGIPPNSPPSLHAKTRAGNHWPAKPPPGWPRYTQPRA